MLNDFTQDELNDIRSVYIDIIDCYQTVDHVASFSKPRDEFNTHSDGAEGAAWKIVQKVAGGEEPTWPDVHEASRQVSMRELELRQEPTKNWQDKVSKKDNEQGYDGFTP